jgi:hypothetical protein
VLATHVDPGQLPGALGLLLDALLPNELERRAEQAHERRGFRLRRKDDGSGWLVTRGELDLECGELLQTVLEAERAVDPDGPADTAAWAASRDGTGDDAAATASGRGSLDEQRHDALRNGLRRYLDSGIAGLREKVAPHLSVTVGSTPCHEAPGSLPAVAGVRGPAPAQPRPALVVRQRRHPLRPRPGAHGPGRQPHRTHADRRRASREADRDRRLCEVAGCACGPGAGSCPTTPRPSPSAARRACPTPSCSASATTATCTSDGRCCG